MIAHLVLFTPRPDLSPAARRSLLESLVEASGDIPSIRRFRVGRRTRHGLPGYEQTMRDDYEFAAIVEFDDSAGLKAYLAHPVLGSRLRECVTALQDLPRADAKAVFGNVDALKLRSSLSLFMRAGGRVLFEAALQRWFSGQAD